MQTVIGAFEDKNTARIAIERLEGFGFDRKDMHLERGDGGASGSTEHSRGAAGQWGFFQTLFGGGEEPAVRHDDSYGDNYDEAVRRGHCVLVVDAHSDSEAERAASVMDELGALDLDEHARWWNTGREGTVSGVASGASAGMPPGTFPGVVTAPTSTDAADASPAASSGADPGREQVGNRVRDRGTARVVQRVSQTPVHEIVRLREEHATMNRQQPDRPATEDKPTR